MPHKIGAFTDRIPLDHSNRFLFGECCSSFFCPNFGWTVILSQYSADRNGNYLLAEKRMASPAISSASLDLLPINLKKRETGLNCPERRALKGNQNSWKAFDKRDAQLKQTNRKRIWQNSNIIWLNKNVFLSLFFFVISSEWVSEWVSVCLREGKEENKKKNVCDSLHWTKGATA